MSSDTTQEAIYLVQHGQITKGHGNMIYSIVLVQMEVLGRMERR